MNPNQLERIKTEYIECVSDKGPAQALKLIDGYIERAPYIPELFALKANALYYLEDYDRSAVFARKGLELRPDSIECLNHLAAACLKREAWEEAGDAIEMLNTIAREEFYTRFLAGRLAYGADQDYIRAARVFWEAAKLKPKDDSPRLWYLEAARRAHPVLRPANRILDWIYDKIDQYNSAFYLFFGCSFILIIAASFYWPVLDKISEAMMLSLGLLLSARLPLDALLQLYPGARKLEKPAKQARSLGAAFGICAGLAALIGWLLTDAETLYYAGITAMGFAPAFALFEHAESQSNSDTAMRYANVVLAAGVCSLASAFFFPAFAPVAFILFIGLAVFRFY